MDLWYMGRRFAQSFVDFIHARLRTRHALDQARHPPVLFHLLVCFQGCPEKDAVAAVWFIFFLGMFAFAFVADTDDLDVHIQTLVMHDRNVRIPPGPSSPGPSPARTTRVRNAPRSTLESSEFQSQARSLRMGATRLPAGSQAELHAPTKK